LAAVARLSPPSFSDVLVLVTVILLVILVVDLDDAFALDVSTERPDEVPGESGDEAAVPPASSFGEPDDGSKDAADEGEPPTKEDGPEEVSGEKVTLSGSGRDGVKSGFGVSSDGSGLLVEGRLPDGQTEWVLGIDGLVDR
jgi:hypothetical protein